MKQRAERAEALEADRKADLRHTQLAGSQQRLGLFDPPVHQILVRRLVERLLKQADKVVAREAGLAGDALQVERLIVAVVDESAGAAQSRANVCLVNHSPPTLT